MNIHVHSANRAIPGAYTCLGLAALESPDRLYRDDEEITRSIKEAIKESGVNANYITVIVSDSVVRLWRAVETKSEHEALNVVLENTTGLESTESNVRIMSLVAVGY